MTTLWKWLLGALAAALIPGASWGLTLSDMETAIRRNVGDTQTDSTLQKYTDPVLDTFINEAQREINTLTWAVETSTSYVLTAQTTYYALPTNYIAAKLVTFTDAAGQTIEMDEYSFKKAYQDESDFERSSVGPPDHYFIRYPGDSDDSLEISYLPVPTTSSTGTVKVWYLAQPSDLSSDSDVPFDGFTHLYPYHYSIVAHVTARIKGIERKYEEAAYFLKELERYITAMNARLGSAPNYSPSIKAAPR